MAGRGERLAGGGDILIEAAIAERRVGREPKSKQFFL
jgi:hypothetical protein